MRETALQTLWSVDEGRKRRCVYFCFISPSDNSVTINSKFSNQIESVLPQWQLANDPPVLSSTHKIFREFSPSGQLGRGVIEQRGGSTRIPQGDVKSL